MDGIKVTYKHGVEMMEYVGPLYKYGGWIIFTKYVKSMQIYKILTNYNRRKGIKTKDHLSIFMKVQQIQAILQVY